MKKSNDLATFVEARLGKPSHLLEGDRLKQFLTQSSKVLRFYAVWDDRGGLYGDRRPYVVHYYLEDDTVEIGEVRSVPSAVLPLLVPGVSSLRHFLRSQTLQSVTCKVCSHLCPAAAVTALVQGYPFQCASVLRSLFHQVHERNSGRDPFPMFLKRGPLPREKPRGASRTGRIPKSLCYK